MSISRALARSVGRGLFRSDAVQAGVAVKLDATLSAVRKRQRPLAALWGARATGVYLHGPVGCGKSVLMDEFVHAAAAEAVPTERVHFHEFMLDVHAHLHVLRDTVPSAEGRLGRVAEDIAARTRVLAFDELAVTDVADALILVQLFRGLWQRGTVVVATSNRAPAELCVSLLLVLRPRATSCCCHAPPAPTTTNSLTSPLSGTRAASTARPSCRSSTSSSASAPSCTWPAASTTAPRAPGTPARSGTGATPPGAGRR